MHNSLLTQRDEALYARDDTHRQELLKTILK